MNFQNIGVIGAGQMGQGIARLFLLKGYNVFIFDADPQQLNAAYQANIDFLSKEFSVNKITAEEKSAYQDCFNTCVQLSYFSECDLVIEAAVENMYVKQDIFANLEKYVRRDCVIATNTSSLSIETLSSSLQYADRFFGIHFFNPVVKLPLVELTPATMCPSILTNNLYELLIDLGKTPILCTDSPGFMVNRVLIPMINQAAKLVDENVASPEDIDRAMKLGASFSMGPLALADLIGIDTCVAILEEMNAQLVTENFTPAQSLLSLKAENKLGKKTKQGFFKYL